MRTTTDAKNWPFTFTVVDLARFLGKSPVTVRGWERSGLIDIPRGDNNVQDQLHLQSGAGSIRSPSDRKIRAREVAGIAKKAYVHGRITRSRRDLVCAAMAIIELIEKENIK